MRKNLEELQEKMKQKGAVARKLSDANTVIPQGRQLCDVCKKRVARAGYTTCSRCPISKLEEQLRDKLPEFPPKPVVFGRCTGCKKEMTQEEYEKHTCIPVTEESNNEKIGQKQEELATESDVGRELGSEEEETTGPGELVRRGEVRAGILATLPSGTEYFTRKEVSAMLELGKNTLSKWEKRGKTPLPKRLVRNNQLVYTREDIEAIKLFMSSVYVAPPVIPTVPGPIEQRTAKFVAKKISKGGLGRRLERTVKTALSSPQIRKIL